MSRPIGVKETKPRKQIAYEPQRGAWVRVWGGNHYRAKGLSLECFKLIASQPCAYCGEPPRLLNPFGKTFEDYNRVNLRPCHEQWFNDQFIYANGVDKIVPTKDYTDIDNLVACCKVCNWMKHTKSKEEFLSKVMRIAKFQNMADELNVSCTSNTSINNAGISRR